MLGEHVSIGLYPPEDQAAALIGSATVLNDQSPVFARTSVAYDPYNRTSVISGARRRRAMDLAGRSIMGDLIEGGRTNLILRSTDPNTTWTKAGVTAATGAASPDGGVTGGTLTETVGAGNHRILQSVTKAASALIYTASVYCKRSVGTRNMLLEMYNSGFTSGASVSVDLGSGTISIAAAVIGSFTTPTAFVRAEGSFYRVILTATSDTDTAIQMLVSMTSGTSNSYTGDGASQNNFSWMQLEQAAFPSSTITTAGASAARIKDALTVTPPVALSTSAGTILAVAIPYGWTGDQDGATSYRVFQTPAATDCSMTRGASATLMNVSRADGGGSETATGLVHGFTHNTVKQAAIVWDAASVRGFIGGAASGVPDSTLTPPYVNTVATITVGDNGGSNVPFFGWVCLLYWPRALITSELAILSTSLMCLLIGVTAWGDSLTLGSGGSGTTICTQLQADATTARAVLNRGVSGDTSSQILTRFNAESSRWDDITVIWAGRNNNTDPTQVKADIASMVGSLRTTRFVVLSVMNANTEPTGNAAYTRIIQLNTDLAALYPNNYLDIRAYIISQYDVNQAQDVTDHTNDVPPNSLRSDFIHLNAAGYTLAGDRINTYMRSRGFA